MGKNDIRQQAYKTMKKFLLVWSVVLVFLPLSAMAATFEIKRSGEVRPENQIRAVVYLKSPEGPVNTVSGKFIYDASVFKQLTVMSGNSVVGAWIEEPKAENGEIIFSGLIPGGAGEGEVFTVLGLPSKNQESFFSLVDGKVFYNDGSGNSAFAGSEQLVFEAKFSESVGEDLPLAVAEDVNPPEQFSIEVARDPKIFENQWFAVFNSRDSESGIAYYEAAEGENNNPGALKWEKTKSPYILKDQSREKYLFIRAVDAAGNAQISVEPALNQKKSILENPLLYAIILVVFLCLGSWFWKQNVKKNK